MENKICQSCGMPITSDEQLGTKYGSQAGMTNEEMITKDKKNVL